MGVNKAWAGLELVILVLPAEKKSCQAFVLSQKFVSLFLIRRLRWKPAILELSLYCRQGPSPCLSSITGVGLSPLGLPARIAALSTSGAFLPQMID